MPTKKQLSELRESQFEFPETRRDDDPMYKKPNSPLPNSDKNVQECDATAAPLIDSPLAQKNPLEDITECYVPVYVKSQDDCPDIEEHVFVQTQWFENDKKVNEHFFGYMDNYGDLIRVTEDNFEEDYGWKFKDCVVFWLKKITLPSPAVSDNSEITPKQETEDEGSLVFVGRDGTGQLFVGDIEVKDESAKGDTISPFTQPSPAVGGMRWIKASERLPEDCWQGKIRRLDDDSLKEFKAMFQLDKSRFDSGSRIFQPRNVEWLEETASPAVNNDEVWNELKEDVFGIDLTDKYMEHLKNKYIIKLK